MRVALSFPGRVLSFLLFALLTAIPAAAGTLVVNPFENTSSVPDLEWVGESFAESLTERLAGGSRLVVTREERLAALERLGLPAAVPFSRAVALRLAEELDAEWLALGRFSLADHQLQVRVQLLDVRRLRLSPVIEEQGSFDELLTIQARLAWRIVRRLEPASAMNWEKFSQQFPQWPVSAFESYVRGLLALTLDQQKGYFLQAARIAPDYGAPAYRLAQIYFENDDYGAAARWFERVPGGDPLEFDARFYLALCHFFQGEPARGSEVLAPLVERLPVVAVWNNLGVFTSRQGGDEKAVEFFRHAREADPSNADIAFNLGLHYVRQEQWAAAAQTLAEGVALNPGDTEGQFLYAHALERLGRSQEAALARQQAVGDNPALALSLERRQLELDRVERNFSAHLARLNQDRGLAPTNAFARMQHVSVHVERGEDLLARGLVEEAQQEFIEAVLLDPDAYQAHLLLADIYQRQGRPSDAISELKAALWSRATVDVRLRLAGLLLQQDRRLEARQQIEAALALEPENEDARALENQLPAEMAETLPDEVEEE